MSIESRMPENRKPHTEQESAAYYQERYARGYMQDWPTARKLRIAEVIRSLELPAKGTALDFGCGNGVFTDVLRQALPPGWEVYGTDISDLAVKNAAQRWPACSFFTANEPESAGRRFDFLFTHHVLEHVHDLPGTLNNINNRLKESAAMLHILPCGNAGSLEHDLCSLRKDGIDPDREGRFFFEDKGHLRRLTTERVSSLFSDKGLILNKEYYRNQHFGAIEWITRADPGVVRLIADSSTATDQSAGKKLRQWRRKLLLLWLARRPALSVEYRSRKKEKNARDYLFMILGLPLYAFSKPFNSWVENKAREEWRLRRTEPNGSEMYLFFKRPAENTVL